MEIHIGKRIKSKLDEKDLSVVRFAKEINTTRENAYGIFKRKSIDTHLLIRISIVLDYNFFNDLSNLVYTNLRTTEFQNNNNSNHLEIEFLKKENTLLKEILDLLKDKMNK